MNTSTQKQAMHTIFRYAGVKYLQVQDLEWSVANNQLFIKNKFKPGGPVAELNFNSIVDVIQKMDSERRIELEEYVVQELIGE